MGYVYHLNPHPLKNRKSAAPKSLVCMSKWVVTQKSGDGFLRVVFYAVRIARVMGRKSFERWLVRTQGPGRRRGLFFKNKFCELIRTSDDEKEYVRASWGAAVLRPYMGPRTKRG